MVNFLVPVNRILSYVTNITQISTAGATININPRGNNAYLSYMYFSIIVITENNEFVDFISINETMPIKDSTPYIFRGKSSKFDFGGVNSPFSFAFFEWTIGTMPSREVVEGFGNPENEVNYWTSIFNTFVKGPKS